MTLGQVLTWGHLPDPLLTAAQASWLAELQALRIYPEFGPPALLAAPKA